MPDPNAFETEDEYMAACVPVAVEEGREQEQAVAMCLQQWRDRGKAEKAGRRLRGSMLGKLKEMKAAFEAWLKSLGEVESWAEYADEEEEPGEEPEMKGTHPVMFKGRDGQTWLLTWTTNAFIDRDKEMFTTKAIEEYIERHEGDADKGRFQLWHMPGTDFGTITWQGMSGRFLVEAGPFDDTPQGRQFKAFFERYPDGHPEYSPSGWATSHGYTYRDGDRDDGVYDWFDKKETSVLPFEAAANQHNPTVEVLTMNEKQKALLREIGGDELVERVLQTGETQTKALEEQGVAYKAEQAAEAPAPEPQPQAVDVKAIADALHLDDLSEGFAQLQASVKAMDAKIAELEKGEAERLAEKAANTPRFAWFRGTQAAAQVLDESNPADAALKAKKPTVPAIAAIAARMGG